jgi:hypothetical protein
MRVQQRGMVQIALLSWLARLVTNAGRLFCRLVAQSVEAGS